MKPLLTALLTALSVTALAQTPAADKTAELERQNRELQQRLTNLQSKSATDLVGKWMTPDGDQIEFTKAGMFTVTIDPLKPEAANKPKSFTGPYVVTPELKLKLINNNRLLMEAEFSVTGDRLSIKRPNGELHDHYKMDHRGIAKLTLQELRQLDSALDQWAIEHNKAAGARPTNEDVRKYIRKGTRLYYALGDPTGPKDVAGNPFAPFVVDSNPKVNPKTFTLVSDVAPKAFWEAFAD